jgi:hypothetical protein
MLCQESTISACFCLIPFKSEIFASHDFWLLPVVFAFLPMAFDFSPLAFAFSPSLPPIL